MELKILAEFLAESTVLIFRTEVWLCLALCPGRIAILLTTADNCRSSC